MIEPPELFDEFFEQIKIIQTILDSEEFRIMLAKYNNMAEANKSKFRHRVYQAHGYYGKGFFEMLDYVRRAK